MDPDGSNVRGVVAYADPASLRDIQVRLWSRDQQQDPHERPVVFTATAYAAWHDVHTPQERPADPLNAGIDVWLGRPIAVTAAPEVHTLRPDAAQAVAHRWRETESFFFCTATRTRTTGGWMR